MILSKLKCLEQLYQFPMKHGCISTLLEIYGKTYAIIFQNRNPGTSLTSLKLINGFVVGGGYNNWGGYGYDSYGGYDGYGGGYGSGYDYNQGYGSGYDYNSYYGNQGWGGNGYGSGYGNQGYDNYNSGE